jgi:alanine racemase
MTVSLTVDRTRWSAHLHHTLEQIRAVATPVPVVKGNGYGFGRHALAEIAADESTTICVGTIHELDGIPDSLTPVVLTPTLHGPTPSAILTVSNETHITPLAGSAQRVIIKLASSMHRYGGPSSLVQHALDTGLDVAGVAIHLPLIATDDERVAEVTALLDPIPTSIPAWLSHIDPSLIARLPDSRTYLLRAGTTLWHGDRKALHLSTDVIDLRPIRAGQHAGYRQTEVIKDGHLVMVGAGSAHGVHPLADGRSPFHFNRRRIDMFELPHMHTTMLFIPQHTTPPAVGDTIDLQRPLTQTTVDEVIWV